MIAGTAYQRQVSAGHVAAIVAASKPGGARSVWGDTAPTTMRIPGINPWDVDHAPVASVVALLSLGLVASWR